MITITRPLTATANPPATVDRAHLRLPALRVRTAWFALTAAIAAAGIDNIPCAGRTEWTAAPGPDRAVAIAGCTGCPVIRECGLYAAKARERFGVWAAIDRDREPPPPSRGTP